MMKTTIWLLLFLVLVLVACTSSQEADDIKAAEEEIQAQLGESDPALAGQASAAQLKFSPISCGDSDGGLNYTQKGTVIVKSVIQESQGRIGVTPERKESQERIISFEFNDSCRKDHLYEYYCVGGKRMAKRVITCDPPEQFRCNNGACADWSLR